MIIEKFALIIIVQSPRQLDPLKFNTTIDCAKDYGHDCGKYCANDCGKDFANDCGDDCAIDCGDYCVNDCGKDDFCAND